MKLRDLIEGKQVGILYHYTDLQNLKSILSDGCILKAGRRSHEEYISFTRLGSFLPKHLSHFGICRFVVDGSKLSNKFKITPDSKHRKFTYDSDGIINGNVWQNKPPEKLQGEERYYGKSLNIKPYILKIQILKKDFLQNGYEVGFNSEKDLTELKNKYGIDIELVNAWSNR